MPLDFSESLPWSLDLIPHATGMSPPPHPTESVVSPTPRAYPITALVTLGGQLSERKNPGQFCSLLYSQKLEYVE
jgi:hypothetical protein